RGRAGGVARGAVGPGPAGRAPPRTRARVWIDAPVHAALAGEPQHAEAIEDGRVQVGTAACIERKSLYLAGLRVDADNRILTAVGHPRCAVGSDDHAVRRRARAKRNFAAAARSR